MSAKAIREVQSLGLIRKHLDVSNAGGVELLNFAAIESEQDLETLPEQHPWLNDSVRNKTFKLIMKTSNFIIC
jgi:hypothetical protein